MTRPRSRQFLMRTAGLAAGSRATRPTAAAESAGAHLVVVRRLRREVAVRVHAAVFAGRAAAAGIKALRGDIDVGPSRYGAPSTPLSAAGGPVGMTFTVLPFEIPAEVPTHTLTLAPRRSPKMSWGSCRALCGSSSAADSSA